MQFKRQITFQPSEGFEVRDAYAKYLLAGGEDSINVWMKKKIMESIRNEAK